MGNIISNPLCTIVEHFNHPLTQAGKAAKWVNSLQYLSICLYMKVRLFFQERFSIVFGSAKSNSFEEIYI